MLIVLVGLIFGLVIGVAQAFVRAYFDNRIKTAEDVKKLTQIPFYGMLPLIRSKRFVVHYLEAVRGIWVNLSFMKGRDASMVVAVSSMIPSEGKTLTVASLSRMIAREGGASVIVLDLDMRRARLHEQFRLENRVGMSTLLAQRCTLEEAIQSTDIEGLDVITSGPRSSSPTGLILSVALELLLRQLTGRYDYVFLDTPPHGLVSDTTRIMQLTDLTLFVLRANFSKREYLRELNSLGSREDRSLGIILNGVDIMKEYGYTEKLEYLDRYLLERHGKEKFWRL
jgi:capsular exopolysaccharide synthesis family protein